MQLWTRFFFLFFLLNREIRVTVESSNAIDCRFRILEHIGSRTFDRCSCSLDNILRKRKKKKKCLTMAFINNNTCESMSKGSS